MHLKPLYCLEKKIQSELNWMKKGKIAYENVKHVVSEEQEIFPRPGVKDTQESSNNLKVIFISFILIVDCEALIIYMNYQKKELLPSHDTCVKCYAESN